VPTGLFRFLQLELPFGLGPADGRWLLRRDRDLLERIIVLRTVGSRRADAPARRKRDDDALAAAVQIARATIIDPAPFALRSEADAWLATIDPAEGAQDAIRWLNRLLHAQRIAAADPYLEELGPEHPLAIRAGYGEGEQVADGRWLRASSLPMPRAGRRGRRRESQRQARAHERLAALLGGHSDPLLCEELALRARRDLDEGRSRLAAIELERACTAATVELEPALHRRVAELRALKPQLTELAIAALRPQETFGSERAAELASALRLLEATLGARSTGGPRRPGP
jgi:hypothetical protein